MEHTMKKIVIFAAVLLSALALDAQDNVVTNMNGKQWRIMNHGDKVVFLAGLSNGLLFASADNAKDMELWSVNLTMEQEALAVDQCYDDPRNMKVPITGCWVFAAGQSRGASPKDLENLMVGFRKAWK